MSKLNQGELLETLGIRFAGVCSKEEARAYEQIAALIKKPEVTEEWIEEKAREFYKKALYVLKPLEHKDIKDFIRSLVEEIQ